MDKSKICKIKTTIPIEDVKQDISSAVIVFAESRKYKVVKTRAFAKLKKGNTLSNMFSKNAAKEIRVDVTENEIRLNAYVNLTFRNPIADANHPDVIAATRELEILESYIRATSPLPILPPRRWYQDALHLSLNIAIIVAIITVGKLALNYFLNQHSQVQQPSPTIPYDTPKVPFKPKDAISYKDVDVFLVPVFNFPEMALQYLADDLSKNLGIKVKATNSMPRQDSAFNAYRNQMPAEAYHEPMREMSARLLSDNPKCIYIAVTHDCLYMKNANYNFVFSTYFDEKHAILGIGQLCSALPENSAQAQQIVSCRIFKMTKRIIGKLYHQLPPSGNPQSLMKSPLMTIKDVDDMGFDY